MHKDIINKIKEIVARRTFNELIEYYHQLFSENLINDFDKPNLSNKIERILEDDSILTRLTPRSTDLITKILNKQINCKYTPVIPDPGKTYLLLIDLNNKSAGTAFFIKVVEPGSHGNDIPQHVCSVVADFIQKHKKETHLLIREYIEKYKFDFVHFNNDTVEEEIGSTSYELPLAVALVSKILNIPVPPEIALSGKVNPDGIISFVNGALPKVTALKREYPEVKKIFLPKDLEKIILSNPEPDTEIALCHEFDKVATELFLDSNPLKKIPSFPGRIELKVNKENYSAIEATKIHVFTEPQNLFYSPTILEQVPVAISSPGIELNRRLTVIDGRMPLWMAAHLTTLFKPISAVVAINDDKVKNDDGTQGGAVVVSINNNNFKYGTILKSEKKNEIL